MTVAGGLRRSPFRGLASYRDTGADAAQFFGRDDELDVVAANLLAARLTILYGPSGVGKSSLVNAGVAQRLRRAAPPPSEDFDVPQRVVVVLDSWTGHARADLLAAVGLDPSDPAPLDEALAALRRERRLELLVIVDQFEALLATDDPFLEELPGLVGRRGLPVRVLVAVRDDALSALDRFKGAIPGLFDNYLRLDRLDAAAAREAIEGPMRGVEGVALQDGLSAAVVDQLATGGRVEPAHLQLVMTRLFDEETAAGSAVLRLSTLERLGGATAIVRGHLAVAMRALPRADQDLSAEVLHHLVTPSGATLALTAGDLAAYVDRPEPPVAALCERLAAGDPRVLRPLPPGRPGGPSAYRLFHDVLAPAVLDWRHDHVRGRLERRGSRLLTALVAVTAVAVAMGVYLADPGVLRSLELATVDARYGMRGTSPAPEDIVLVLQDDRALERLGTEHTTPDGPASLVPRDAMAAVVDRLVAGGARAIAYDLLIHSEVEPLDGGGDRADGALAAALRRAGPRVVVGAFEYRVAGRDVVPQLAELVPAGARERAGFVGLPDDEDGVQRRIDYAVDTGGKPLRTLAARTVQEATGRLPGGTGAARRRVGEQTDETTWIDYRGPFRRVSVLDVHDGKVPASAFREKIVVVGTAAGDRHPTPAGDEPLLGAEIHANAIATLRDGSPLRDSRLLDVVLIVAMGASAVLLRVVRPRWGPPAVVAGAALLALVTAYVAFAAGRVVAVVAPLLALAVAALAALAVALVRRWKAP